MESGLLVNGIESNLGDLLQRNKATIIQHMNLPLLAPALAQNDLLDMVQPIWKDNSVLSRTEFLNMIVNKSSSAHLRFAQSVKATNCHLGHQYITSILEETEFESEEVISLSRKYQEAIKNTMTDMIEIDLPSLMPHMRKHNLLTGEEAALLLRNDEISTIKKMTLFSILHNKGPTAHYLFVQCLSEEKQHPQHQELRRKICKMGQLQSPSPKRRRPRELKVRKPLKGKEYDDRRICFESHYHNEEWEEVETLSEECLQNEQLEVQAIGHLECALSWIFRVDKQQTIHRINLAKQVCEKIPCDNDNRIFLEGRGEYLLALLYLYLEAPQKAKDHVQRAKAILFYTEVGEDKTFACYVDAKVAASELSSTPTPEQLQNVIRLFTFALECAEYSENLDILVIYSLLRLCELYLHTTLQTLGACPQANLTELSVREQENIHSASDCLERVRTTYYDSMDLRCRCIYKLTECNLHRCCGRVNEAIQSVKDAKRLIHRNSSYKIELKQVTEVLKSLT